MSAIQSITKRERSQSGSTVLYVLVGAGIMGLSIMSFNSYVNNNIQASHIERLKGAREVAYRNLMAMASSTSTLYLSSRMGGGGNASLKDCLDAGAGLCTSTSTFLPFQLYVPHATGHAPVVASSNDPSGSDNQGRFTVSGFPSSKCSAESACAFFGRTYFKAECANGAPTCGQASIIKVRGVIQYRPSPVTEFPPWLQQLNLAQLPTSADLSSRAADYEKAIYAKDIELTSGAVLCPPNSSILGVNSEGTATCACKVGYANSNGSTTTPDCVAMRRCIEPAVLIGINNDGTPNCSSPIVKDYDCSIVRPTGSRNSFSCGADGRMKGAYIADDCLVDGSGIVHCDQVEINCCKPR